MIGRKDGENVNDGVGSGIGVSVWSFEKNGVVCLPLRRNEGNAWEGGGVCPRQTGVGKNDWVYPRQIESDVDDVSSRCFSASLPLLHPPCASSDDSYLSHGPSLDPSHEKTHPSTASPSPPSQLPQPSASAPTARPPLVPLELPGPLGISP